MGAAAEDGETRAMRNLGGGSSRAESQPQLGTGSLWATFDLGDVDAMRGASDVLELVRRMAGIVSLDP